MSVDKNYLYIEPYGGCNLNCKMCYTHRDPSRDIPAEHILDFVEKFIKYKKRRIWIYWCGSGEIFLKKDFPEIMNTLLLRYKKNVHHIIQTNGTLNRLNEFITLQNVDFSVSIDCFQKYHDLNRGAGTFKRTMSFCRDVRKRERPLKIRMLATKQTIPEVKRFEKYIKSTLGVRTNLKITLPYQKQYRISDDDENSIPDRNFDKDDRDLYLALHPKGVYNCCEEKVKLGSYKEGIGKLFSKLTKSYARCKKCSLFSECF